ncbi:LacI family DNA-binding transcriptional regulator [Devosia sp. YIM 151766]|uniref:LacI family DNA-binding transcriptional regulator n=1 Tax=Devosia sp. YIM 151766 TaxID=3017325 RepID=UPI00255CEE67|nr:LacI family DNA-binding transcriptional regulator [Devosia sp. YIM 151766]WIY53589.1 LacI family DNA-binding transcriptional regulator [Devosia sp. YIM 151766]
MSRKSATLIEVAKLAGVSTATVNRVLKRQGYISNEAREKVLAAVTATNYRPNVVARGLRTQRTFTIGLMITAITVNPLFVSVAHAVEAAAIAAGYRVVIFNHGGSESYERHGIETFIAQRVDAVLFCTAASAQNVEILAGAGIPAIEIERSSTQSASFVRVDNYVGARAAIDHLVGLGHERIAFVGGDPVLYSRDAARQRSVEEDRLAAYGDGMADHGLDVQSNYVRLGQYYDLANDQCGADGRRHTEALMQLPKPPTAIFATCDILAVGVLQALYQAGKRVPQDISVVGFDDTLAAYLAPQLTTVAQPLAALGRAGFDMALAAIEKREMPSEIVLDTTLVVRQSTGKFI